MLLSDKRAPNDLLPRAWLQRPGVASVTSGEWRELSADQHRWRISSLYRVVFHFSSCWRFLAEQRKEVNYVCEASKYIVGACRRQGSSQCIVSGSCVLQASDISLSQFLKDPLSKTK
ncbi:hypothetical protein LSAT2_002218 [Lamellibrachia satsuma]|nr:hypothetical protein LSAT2_002218 [Lamellibrachia satsuma]